MTSLLLYPSFKNAGESNLPYYVQPWFVFLPPIQEQGCNQNSHDSSSRGSWCEEVGRAVKTIQQSQGQQRCDSPCEPKKQNNAINYSPFFPKPFQGNHADAIHRKANPASLNFKFCSSSVFFLPRITKQQTNEVIYWPSKDCEAWGFGPGAKGFDQQWH